jgi:release factor glutamine methyltransferase
MKLSNYCLNFFKTHQNFLELNYPGITFRNFMRDILDLFQKNSGPIGWDFENSEYFFSKGDKLDLYLSNVLQGLPLQYCRSESHFNDITLFTPQGIFIPRQETELLVELALNELSGVMTKLSSRGSVNIVEVGIGSGCISLLMMTKLSEFKKNPSDVTFNFLGIDLNDLALKVSSENFKKLNYRINPKFSFNVKKGNQLKLENEYSTESFLNEDKISKSHLIVTNPPYVHENKDLDNVHFNVTKHEPPLAVFLKDEEYFPWFERLFDQVFENLYDGGSFVMEGHEDHLEELASIMKRKNFQDVRLHMDFTNRYRFITAKKNI